MLTFELISKGLSQIEAALILCFVLDTFLLRMYPKVAFSKIWGAFEDLLYPKWLVFHDLGCIFVQNVSQICYFKDLGYFLGAVCIPNDLFFMIWDVFLFRMYPKVAISKIWGVFEGLFVSQMACFS